MEDGGNEKRLRRAQENEVTDQLYGFEKLKDNGEHYGWLINMHPSDVIDEEKRLVSAVDYYFLREDGSRFRVSLPYRPYFYVATRENCEHEVLGFLSKRYSGKLSSLDLVEKEDLDLANHLIGLKKSYIKLSFLSVDDLMKVKRELTPKVKSNREKESAKTAYTTLLANHFSGEQSNEYASKVVDQTDNLLDIREHDVPYHVRVSIDLKIFVGVWYKVVTKGQSPPEISVYEDLVDRPDPVVLAYDIETTKLPLKFPDASSDQIMMISYMIDGDGFLICNREIIAQDIEDFEFTPRPEFEGVFAVFNEPDEKATIERFFNHIRERQPSIFVTYNGDFFDWPFVETRASVHGLNMLEEIGFAKDNQNEYKSRPAIHMDCLKWVKRDSYLPVGSQGLKAVAKAKLRYNPVEIDPEDMCRLAAEDPRPLANYSVSDAVATYYLYMKYVHPFIFALCTIIPMEPDEVLRKGSGTLCEALLMVQAYHANIVYPNKQEAQLNKLTADGHVLDQETYVGGHVEALESGVFRSNLPCKFKMVPEAFQELIDGVEGTMRHAVEVEEGVPVSECKDFEAICSQIREKLEDLRDNPVRVENPIIYHLDVGAMYPNIILTNRLQPSALVDASVCAACDFNRPGERCQRRMTWTWRGEVMPANRSEYQRIQAQLEQERFPAAADKITGRRPPGQTRAFYQLTREEQAAVEKKRLADFCRRAYKKTHVTRVEERTATICQRENSFYVDTVRAFRDRRYKFKGLCKVWKKKLDEAVANGDAGEIKRCNGMLVLYDSLQLAHKCILNSFYGYVMRKGARWYSMEMAGVVCHTGASIITKAREIVEQIGRPLELDTDGIWCVLPASFPENYNITTNNAKKPKVFVSYPGAMLNVMVQKHFTNDQYHELEDAGSLKYSVRSENSIFFEVDGPYLAMMLPASKEEGKKLKKRYAVFNFDGSLAELKGFEVKRNGELQLIKIFQSSVFEAFLKGETLAECYGSVARVADYWLDVLYSRAESMPDTELFELIAENRSMSKKLEDYGGQKSTSISTAKRLAEFLGDQMVKDAGLACKFVISKKPEGAPVTERAIPLAIFQAEVSVKRHFLRRWLKTPNLQDLDIRNILDWDYYIERLSNAVQKIITIPAALQHVANPVPRVQHPDWLRKKLLEKNDVFKQRKISDIFQKAPKQAADIEDFGRRQSGAAATPAASRKRRLSEVDGAEEATTPAAQPTQESKEFDLDKPWYESLGEPPRLTDGKENLMEWLSFHKRKWRLQRAQRGGRGSASGLLGQSRGPKRPRQSAPNSAGLSSFIRRSQRALLDRPWQILHVGATSEPGQFRLWLLVDQEPRSVRVHVPRVFYVNHLTPKAECPPDAERQYRRVNKTLPRSRPLQHLYEYRMPESVYQANREAVDNQLLSSDVAGVYELGVAPLTRAVLSLGCVCVVERDFARQLVAAGRDNDLFPLDSLCLRSSSQFDYVRSSDSLKLSHFYHHSSGRLHVFAVFLPAGQPACHVFVLDTAKANLMSGLPTLYQSERRRREAVLAEELAEELAGFMPPEQFSFEVKVELSMEAIVRGVEKRLSGYKFDKRTPTLMTVESVSGLSEELRRFHSLQEFPLIPIPSQPATDEAEDNYQVLDWQRVAAKRLIGHYLDSCATFARQLHTARYYQVPVGNLPTAGPAASATFGIDVFLGRTLAKQNHLLWCSDTELPDLGGLEVDDLRLSVDAGNEIRPCESVNPGFYPEYCAHIDVNSLAVCTIVQSARIRELEGGAHTYESLPVQGLEEMVESAAVSVSQYDETAACSTAFRIIRSLALAWIRDVAQYSHSCADSLLVHLYGWFRSSQSLFYDPALRRTLHRLMQKMHIHLLAELQQLGAKIVLADFYNILVATGKRCVADCASYAQYICQTVCSKDYFHALDLEPSYCYSALLLLDRANYCGVRYDRDDHEQDGDEEEEADGWQRRVDWQWNIGDFLPAGAQPVFRTILNGFLLTAEGFLYDDAEPLAAGKGLEEALVRLVQGDVSQELMTQIDALKGSGDEFPEPPGRHLEYRSAGLEFAKSVCRVLSLVDCVAEPLDRLRASLLRLAGVGEFAPSAEWRNPCNSLVLAEVACPACDCVRNLDLCRDPLVAEGPQSLSSWLCPRCSTPYPVAGMQRRLLDTARSLALHYLLQDVRCSKCQLVLDASLPRLCACAGQFECSVQPDELRVQLRSLLSVSQHFGMPLLRETALRLLQFV